MQKATQFHSAELSLQERISNEPGLHEILEELLRLTSNVRLSTG